MAGRRPHFRSGGYDFYLVEASDVIHVDQRRAVEIIDAMWATPAGQARLRAEFGSDGASDETIRSRAVDSCSTVDQVLVRIDAAPRPIDPLPARPLVPPVEDPDEPAPQRPTWIQLQILGERGRSFPRHRLELTLPDGDVREGVLDDDSRWRLDDVPARGTCHLRIRQSFETSAGGSEPGLQTRDEDIWIAPQDQSPVALVTEHVHRLIVVDGRTEIVLLDDRDAPIANEPCEVLAAQRVLKGTTDDRGVFVAVHPARTDAVEVRFTALDRAAWQLDSSRP